MNRTTATRFTGFNRRNLTTLAAALALAAGGVASAATIDNHRLSRTISNTDDESRQVITVMGDDNKRIRIEIVGDRDPVVEYDGKKLGKNRWTYDRADGEIIVLDEHGEKLRAVTVLTQAGPTGPGQWRGFAATAGGARDLARFAEREAMSGRPPVMIGIYRTDPSPELAAQLGLDEGSAFVIERVVPGLGADRAGIKTFDVVVTVDGKPASKLGEVLESKKPGAEAVFEVIRRGEKKKFTVTLDAYDAVSLGVVEPEDARQGIARISPPSPPGFPETPRPDRLRAEEQYKSAIDKAMAQLESQLSREELDKARRAVEEAMAQLHEQARDQQSEFAPRLERLREQLDAGASSPRGLRFDDGKLIIGGQNSWQDELAAKWEDRLNALEDRFEELEDRWEEMAEHLADRLEDRLDAMFERIERRLSDD